MKTKYYRLIAEGSGAYGFSYDGIILAIRGDREWLLTDEWCGSGMEGECYRHHVDGRLRPWPKAAAGAEDLTEKLEKLISDSELQSWEIIRRVGAKGVREMLGL